MMKRFVCAIVLAGLCAIPLAAQSGGGLRYVMKMELQPLPGEQKQADNPMAAMMVEQIKKTMFPQGPVEMEFVTDGESMRTEVHTDWVLAPKGSIMVQAVGQTDAYVMNPADKTYYVMKAPTMPAGMSLPKPEISVKPSGTFETILGYRAEKITITIRIPIPVPEGVELPPGIPTELTMEMENWCSTEFKMPAAARRMIAGAEASMPGMGLEEMAKACPFPLRSSMRMSMLPGYAIVSTVTSAAPASPGPELFKLPAGYKEVPMPTPKVPGVHE